jgi:hypothetical protein
VKRIRTTFALISVLAVVSACSKGRPDFTGTWVESDGQPIPGATNDPDLEPRLIIQQDDTRLSIWTEVISKSNPSRKTKLGPSIINFNGNEKRNSDGSVSKSYWKGNSLILESTLTIRSGATSTMINTWSLDSAGHLVVDHLLKDSDKPKPAHMRSTMSRVQP